jgi:hypothetical protein
LGNEQLPTSKDAFAHEDIRGLLGFYRSELGKKTIAMMPAVMEEAAAVGQKWSERHMARITSLLESRLREEGFIK